jgi:hypothetical protein
MADKCLSVRLLIFLVSGLWLSLFFFQTPPSMAQTSTGTFGTVLGVVTDETGAVITKGERCCNQ